MMWRVAAAEVRHSRATVCVHFEAFFGLLLKVEVEVPSLGHLSQAWDTQ